MHHNKRQVKRAHLIYYLRIFDSVTHREIGHLVDLSSQGMMIISEEPIPVGKELSCTMELPVPIDGCHEIAFTANCRWCKKDYNPAYYLSGCRFEDIRSEEVETIKYLINTFGFKRK